jgi:hypothetical protein
MGAAALSCMASSKCMRGKAKSVPHGLFVVARVEVIAKRQPSQANLRRRFRSSPPMLQARMMTVQRMKYRLALAFLETSKSPASSGEDAQALAHLDFPPRDDA